MRLFSAGDHNVHNFRCDAGLLPSSEVLRGLHLYFRLKLQYCGRVFQFTPHLVFRSKCMLLRDILVMYCHARYLNANALLFSRIAPYLCEDFLWPSKKTAIISLLSVATTTSMLFGRQIQRGRARLQTRRARLSSAQSNLTQMRRFTWSASVRRLAGNRISGVRCSGD